MTSLKNIVVYNVPEETSTLKADNAIHDTNLMKELLGHTTGGKYQPEDLLVKRLGSKQTKETETEEIKSSFTCNLSRRGQKSHSYEKSIQTEKQR